MTVSVLCFFFQKTKQKNINLPADIDIFIYLIKIDCVGVKRVATGVLWTNTRINTEGSTKCCRTCCKVSKIRFPCLCQCGLMAHNDLQSEWVLVDLYLSGSEVQSENVFFIIIILSLGLGVGKEKKWSVIFIWRLSLFSLLYVVVNNKKQALFHYPCKIEKTQSLF